MKCARYLVRSAYRIKPIDGDMIVKVWEYCTMQYVDIISFTEVYNLNVCSTKTIASPNCVMPTILVGGVTLN